MEYKLHISYNILYSHIDVQYVIYIMKILEKIIKLDIGRVIEITQKIGY